MNTKNKSMSKRILEILKDNPGLLQHEIVEKCNRTHKTRSTVCSALWRLKASGRIIHEKGLYYAGENSHE